MKQTKWFFWIGVLIVAASHVYILFFGLPENQIIAHSIINLLAAVLLIFAWQKRR